MKDGLGRVPFISAAFVHRIFHPLRYGADFTHGNKEIAKADTLQHRKKKMSGLWI